MRRLVMLLVLVVVLVPGEVRAQDADQLFTGANALYEQGRWSDAASEYLRILDSGAESAPLHLNLGSSYYQLGRTGDAFYHFMKALRLDPSLHEARQNMHYLQGAEFIPPVPSPRYLLLVRIAWLGSFLLIIGAAAVTIRSRAGAGRISAGLLIAGVLVAGIALIASARGFSGVDVLTRGPAPAFATHDGLDRSGFDISEGSIVRVIDRRGPRLLVEADGRQGWVDAYRVRSL